MPPADGRNIIPHPPDGLPELPRPVSAGRNGSHAALAQRRTVQWLSATRTNLHTGLAATLPL